MLIILSAEQRRQILKIAFPDLYKAAEGGEVTWLSLWDGDERVDGVRRQSTPVRIDESDGNVVIAADERSFTAPRTLTDPGIGWSLTRRARPFCWKPIAPRPIYSGYVVTLKNITAGVT